ncbi:MAG: shikimate dehydrogenase [Bacteroidota bacterium]
MKTYGLIGQSLKHSFSQAFFESYFNQHTIDAQYLNFELVSIKDFPKLVENQNINGLNVTIPYKEEIIQYTNELSDVAKKVGAVNVLQFSQGKIIGHNSDVFGFRQSVKPFLTFHHEKALIIGTGGAAKAVAYALRELGIEVIFLSRSPKNEHEFSYQLANKIMIGAIKLIINTTPVGMYPNESGQIPLCYEAMTEDHLVIDLIYNPSETKFLQEAKKHGATTLNGESMLKHQALQSWEIWNQL